MQHSPVRTVARGTARSPFRLLLPRPRRSVVAVWTILGLRGGLLLGILAGIAICVGIGYDFGFSSYAASLIVFTLLMSAVFGVVIGAITGLVSGLVLSSISRALSSQYSLRTRKQVLIAVAGVTVGIVGFVLLFTLFNRNSWFVYPPTIASALLASMASAQLPPVTPWPVGDSSPTRSSDRPQLMGRH